MKNNTHLFKSTIQITIISVLSIVLNFISQLVIAYYYGTSFERDAYLAALVIPMYLNAVFVGSIGYVFLTRFQKIEREGNENSLNLFLTQVFLVIGVLLLFVVLFGMFFSTSIIRTSVPGFSEAQIHYTSKILIAVIPSTLFFILSSFFVSIYQINNYFLKPALIPLVIPTISTLFVFFFTSRFGIISLAYGYTVGSFLSFILLSNVLRKVNYRFTLRGGDNRHLLMLFKTATPLFLFGFIFRFTPVFERMLASNLPNGSISYLGYGNQLLSIMATITSGGIAVSLFPLLSKYWIEDRKIEVGVLVVKATRIILLLTIPITFIVFFWGDIIVKLLLERGAFDHNSTNAVSLGLCLMMGAFIAQSLGNVVAKVFYFSANTWTISIIATIELVLYLFLGYYLSISYSYLGLAVALSISSIVNIIISILYINKYVVRLSLNKISIDLLRVTVVSFISFFSVYKFCAFFSLFSYVNTLFAFIFGLLLFYILGLLFKIEEMSQLTTYIKVKLGYR
ncbi:murein biosynthesis integral membrane protein MurJ [Williamwhitmania taraxaci]|uniref:Murein biosynthesis integral membrane protein MurJ n=1 Tax=Williamwhitmania taraxaci TaxID=1640674 RepID=A0A1G6GLK4_9BACT|nr:lipid II flippase MurJ [Williamwhitmania taraxaci]SDB82804.1 murein biosynthesis integral membrane protein MurJ [Williamwhitmania taraxaci]